MAKKPTRIRVREIEVERLVVREPGGGRVRAVIETVAGKRGRAATVRFAMLGPDGQPSLIADVDGNGDAHVTLGDPDCGEALMLTRRAIEVWAGGNSVAAMWARKGAGHFELLNRAGGTAFKAPRTR